MPQFFFFTCAVLTLTQSTTFIVSCTRRLETWDSTVVVYAPSLFDKQAQALYSSRKCSWATKQRPATASLTCTRSVQHGGFQFCPSRVAAGAARRRPGQAKPARLPPWGSSMAPLARPRQDDVPPGTTRPLAWTRRGGAAHRAADAGVCGGEMHGVKSQQMISKNQ